MVGITYSIESGKHNIRKNQVNPLKNLMQNVLSDKHLDKKNSDRNTVHPLVHTIPNTPIDAVITYVNGNDPVWQKSYEQTNGKTIDIKRYRSWENLDILIASIRKFMPWIKNIILLVSNVEQVCEYDLVKYNVKIITHKEFIDDKYLPTFNCNPIELSFNNIKELSENFIYFNDDMFPIAPVSEQDFFINDKPNYKFFTKSYTKVKRNDLMMFYDICRNSFNLAKKITNGKFDKGKYVCPQHCCLPHKKSAYSDIWKSQEKELSSKMTKTRNKNNYNQYLSADYLYFKKHYNDKELPFKYTSFEFSNLKQSTKDICECINKRVNKIICINDAGIDNISDSDFEKTKKSINDALRKNLNK